MGLCSPPPPHHRWCFGARVPLLCLEVAAAGDGQTLAAGGGGQAALLSCPGWTPPDLCGQLEVSGGSSEPLLQDSELPQMTGHPSTGDSCHAPKCCGHVRSFQNSVAMGDLGRGPEPSMKVGPSATQCQVEAWGLPAASPEARGRPAHAYACGWPAALPATGQPGVCGPGHLLPCLVGPTCCFCWPLGVFFSAQGLLCQTAPFLGLVSRGRMARRGHSLLSLQGPLLRWLKVNFSEAFIAWVHIKALRVFVESVLR